MLKIQTIVKSSLIVGLIAATLSTQIVSADCAGVPTSLVECGTVDNGVWSLLLLALNILAAGIGITAVAGIVYGSILYTAAADNAEQLSKAKDIIRNVIIGLFAFAGMYSLLQYLVPGGIFDRDFSLPAGQGNTGAGGGSGSSSGGDDGKGTVSGDGKVREAVIRVVSYNILVGDLYQQGGVNKFSTTERMKQAAALINSRKADIAIIQELNLAGQRAELKGFMTGWASTSSDTTNQDVFIFWRQSEFTRMASGSYKIPVLVGKPERAQPWVKLRHKSSNQTLYVFGLHLATDDAYEKVGATAAAEQIKRKTSGRSIPFIVGGDMNSNDVGDATTANIFQATGLMKNARNSSPASSGQNCDTHHEIGSQDCRTTRGRHIDHVWVSKKPNVKVENYVNVADNQTKYISDHNPIVVKLRIPR